MRSDIEMQTSFTCGRLLCREVRDQLQYLQFSGSIEAYYETSGWIERTFHIKGTPAQIQMIGAQFHQWCLDNDLYNSPDSLR